MKLNQIAIAVAAMAAAPAFALTPAQVSGATQLWITGASAPTNSVFQGAMTLCEGMSYKDSAGNVQTNPGTLNVHLYLESTGAEPGKSSGDRVAYACKVGTYDTRAGTLEGQNVVIYHTVEGGSFNAYSPALKLAGDTNANLPTSLSRITEVADLSATGKCAAGTPTNMLLTVSGVVNNNVGTTTTPVAGTAIQRWNSCNDTTSTGGTNKGLTKVTLATPTTAATVNVAGDAAPTNSIGGFSDTEYPINKLNLDVDTDLSAIGGEVATNIGQAFGVAVSYPLYFQLQKNDIALGKIAATCDDAPSTSSAPNLTGACQPNMAASTYTFVANKDSISGVDGTLFGAAATPPGTSGKIQLERRAITSGTQSASNLRFLNKPCATGIVGGALNPAVTSTAKVDVALNSGTGDVKKGLTNASNAGEFGLGVVSMENLPGSDKWAFVKLDNVSPNFNADGSADAKQRANAIEGSYSMWYELVAFTATTAVGTDGEALISGINTSLGNPNITDLTGLFITPVAGVSGANVSKTARAGNSCQPAF